MTNYDDLGVGLSQIQPGTTASETMLRCLPYLEACGWHPIEAEGNCITLENHRQHTITILFRRNTLGRTSFTRLAEAQDFPQDRFLVVNRPKKGHVMLDSTHLVQLEKP